MCRFCKHLLDAKWLTPRKENFTRNKNNYRLSDAAAVAQTANKRRNSVRIREDSGLIAVDRRRWEQRSVCERTGHVKAKFGSEIEKDVQICVSNIREKLWTDRSDTQPHHIPTVCPNSAFCLEIKTDTAWPGKVSGAGAGAGAIASASDSTQLSFPSEI